MGDLPPILLAIGQHFLKLRPRICPCGLFIREDFEHGQAVVRTEIVELGLLSWKAVVLVSLFRCRYSEVADCAIL